MKRLTFTTLARLALLCGRLTAADKPNLIFILSDDIAEKTNVAALHPDYRLVISMR